MLATLEPSSQASILAGYVFPFGWSPNGEFIYAIRGDSEIIRIRASNPHDVVSLFNLPGKTVDWGTAAISPDGREMVFSLSDRKSDVW